MFTRKWLFDNQFEVKPAPLLWYGDCRLNTYYLVSLAVL